MKWYRKEKQDPTLTLKQQQGEKLVDMGTQLSAKRQEKGLSIEDMALNTKIGLRVLEAIEKGDLDALPEPVYTQGFIRRYASALGYDGVEFASSFPIGQSNITLKPILKTSSLGQLRPVHMYFFYVLLIIGSVSGLSNFLSSETISRKRENQEISTPTALKPTTSSSAIANVQTVSDTFSRTNETENVQIGVTLKQTSWIEVIADGKIAFEGTLPQGTQRTWIAQKELTLKAGNAGGVLLSVNKQKAKQMGEPGSVEKLTFAAKPN